MRLNDASISPFILQTFNEVEDEATVPLEGVKIRKAFPESWIFDVFDAVLVEF